MFSLGNKEKDPKESGSTSPTKPFRTVKMSNRSHMVAPLVCFLWNPGEMLGFKYARKCWDFEAYLLVKCLTCGSSEEKRKKTWN
jgi:hypothetical protein